MAQSATDTSEVYNFATSASMCRCHSPLYVTIQDLFLPFLSLSFPFFLKWWGTSYFPQKPSSLMHFLPLEGDCECVFVEMASNGSSASGNTSSVWFCWPNSLPNDRPFKLKLDMLSFYDFALFRSLLDLSHDPNIVDHYFVAQISILHWVIPWCILFQFLKLPFTRIPSSVDLTFSLSTPYFHVLLRISIIPLLRVLLIYLLIIFMIIWFSLWSSQSPWSAYLIISARPTYHTIIEGICSAKWNLLSRFRSLIF